MIIMSDQPANIALYRKYCPTNFDEVRDQDHIVSVLKGAIKKEVIPHGIMFSGSRGTGKTTLARIFAQSIGTSPIDIYEMDAASNRGIDDIRELREAVHTVPYESKYKVYIIDEVHMLTKEAFNALLKTLEEPPAHVVFMLATTEEEKLPDTILSRLQVFKLRAPSRAVLASTVTDVAKSEGFSLSSDAADLIAVSADGSFRDALGITQKVIMASGDTIGSSDEVATIIGAPKVALIESILMALHEKNTAKGLEAVASAVASNAEIKILVRLLLEHVRAVMLLRNHPGNSSEILAQFGESMRTTLTALAGASSTPLNSHLLLKLLTVSDQTNRSPIPHLPLEIMVVEVTGTPT
jgi:DNA polymerase-3 subunit gamma/tau